MNLYHLVNTNTRGIIHFIEYPDAIGLSYQVFYHALKWIILSDNWAWRFMPASARYSAKKQQQWQSTYVCNSSCIYVQGSDSSALYISWVSHFFIICFTQAGEHKQRIFCPWCLLKTKKCGKTSPSAAHLMPQKIQQHF